MMRKCLLILAITALVLSSMPVNAASPFPDLQESHWAYDYVITLYAAGLLIGYPDGTLQVNETMKRSETIRLVADTFTYLNDRIDALKGQDSTPGDQNAQYIRTIVEEALVEKVGAPVDKGTVDDLVASIADMKNNLEVELAIMGVRLDSLDAELNAFEKEMEAMKAAFKADLDSIRLSFLSELNDIKAALNRVDAKVVTVDQKVDKLESRVNTVENALTGVARDVSGVKKDVAALSGDVAALSGDVATFKEGVTKDMDALKGDVSQLAQDVGGVKQGVSDALSGIDAINEKLEKFQLSGTSEVIARVVIPQGIDLDDPSAVNGTIFEGLSSSQAFRHEFTLNLGIRPDDDVFISMGLKGANYFGAGVPMAFDLKEVQMSVDAPDFLGVYGSVGPITLSDLALKNFSAQGAQLSLKQGVLAGSQVFILEDPVTLGKYMVGASATTQITDNMEAGVAFAQVFQGMAHTTVDRMIAVFTESSLFSTDWTLRTDLVSAGNPGNQDDMAAKIVADGPIGNVSTTFTYASTGATYSPLSVGGNQAQPGSAPGTSLADLAASMPISVIPGFTAKAGVTVNQPSGILATRVGANYVFSLDTDTDFELDVNREMSGGTATDTGYLKMDWNNPIPDTLLSVKYAVEPSDRKTTVGFGWNMTENLDLHVGYVGSLSKTVSDVGIDFGFALGGFDAGLNVLYRTTRLLPGPSGPVVDTIANLTLERQLTKSTGLNIGMKSLTSTDELGVSRSASVTSASVKVDF